MKHLNKFSLITLFFALIFTVGLNAQMKDSTKHHDKAQMKEIKELKEKKELKEIKEAKKKKEMKEKKAMDHSGHMQKMMKDSSMAQTSSKVIFNKYCPVRGEEVDPETPTVEYKGKNIGFCCPGCDKKFNKDPEKYMGNLSEDGQIFVGTK